MKVLIVSAALCLAMIAAPSMAQEGSRATTGAGTTADPVERVRPEIERRRSFDLQRGASPMATDPRFGPPSAFGSGGPGAGSGMDSGIGSGRFGAGSGSRR